MAVSNWSLGHRPALDGLRGVAILLVLASHFGVPMLMGGGATGVSMFFTLSGFLITALLLDELRANGRISIAAFYRRRAFRLLPALIALSLSLLALSLWLGDEVATIPGTLLVLMYVSNWAQISAEHGVAQLGHTWSLGVEEQFYVLWPLLLILCRGRLQIMLAVTVIGSAVAMVERAFIWDGGDGVRRVYMGTDTRADALLLGCLVAILVHGVQTCAAPRRLLLWLTLITAALMSFSTGLQPHILVPYVVPPLTAVVVWLLMTGTTCRPLEARWLRVVGQRSYGLYLWHAPIASMLLPRLMGDMPWIVALVLGLSLSWLLTLASWRYIEAPFLTRKQPRTTTIAAQRPLKV